MTERRYDIESFMVVEGRDGRRVALGLDRKNNLYANGEPILVYRRIALTGWQRVGVALVVASVVLTGAATVAGIVIQHWSRIHPWIVQVAQFVS
jgi:hypothetical protein